MRVRPQMRCVPQLFFLEKGPIPGGEKPRLLDVDATMSSHCMCVCVCVLATSKIRVSVGYKERKNEQRFLLV